MTVDRRPWLILTERYGSDQRAPSDEARAAAICALFDPTVDDEEHGEASLRRGFDDGPMYLLAFTCGGRARFEEWADQDFVHELVPTRHATDLVEEEALALWSALAVGDIDTVRRFRWNVGMVC